MASRTFSVTHAALTMATATALAAACGGAVQSNTTPDGGLDSATPDVGVADVVAGDAGAGDVVGPDADAAADDAPAVDGAAEDAPDVADANACPPWVVVSLAAPVFDPSPAAGVVNLGTAWSITCPGAPPGTTIYYTTDGSAPTEKSSVFAGPSLSFTRVGPWTINAICLPPPADCVAGSFGTATYMVGTWPVCDCVTAPAVVSPVAGTMNNDFICSMVSATPTATICYTTDGTIPTCDAATAACSGVSKQYDAATGVRIDGTVTDGMGTVVVQTVTCAVGLTPSPIIPVTYVLAVADPTMANPTPGAYSLPGDGGGLTPTMSTMTMDSPGSPVWLSLAADGGSPSCADAQFPSPTTFGGQAGEPSPLTSTTTVSAVACKHGYKPSNVASFAYTIP
jgi:hypothetical protein